MHIAIAGNIGSGKTTLTGLLAKHLKLEPHYENVEENPYLYDFYEDMQRWSFNLQVYFLQNRFRQILEIREKGRNVVQDRTIYEDAYIFAPNLYNMGLMTTRDFKTYQELFQLIASFVKPPDLLIYLRASVPALVQQIQKRGRGFEAGIRLDYLKKLNDRYEAWIENYDLGKLLTVEVDTCNFIEDEEALGSIINGIQAELFGLV